MVDGEGRVRGSLWSYAYQIQPPEFEKRLGLLRRLLDDEHTRAEREAVTWAARVVTEKRVTHILIVSDSPDQHREVNRRLEAELERLRVDFSLTAPMQVDDDAAEPPRPEDDPE